MSFHHLTKELTPTALPNPLQRMHTQPDLNQKIPNFFFSSFFLLFSANHLVSLYQLVLRIRFDSVLKVIQIVVIKIHYKWCCSEEVIQ